MPEKTLFKIDYKYISLLISIYILANFFMLFNGGYFWDDWCMITSESRNALLSGVGSKITVFIFNWLFKLTNNPPLFFHILIAITEITTLVFAYLILTKIINNKSIIFIAILLLSVLPYYQTKILISCFSYTIGICLFTISCFLFCIILKNNNLLLRISSLILYFISFIFLPSTLLIMLFFISLLIYIHNDNILEKKLNLSKYYFNNLFKKIDFILLPFIFWIFRLLYLMPIGVYKSSNYREFKIESVLKSPFNLLNLFSTEILLFPRLYDVGFSYLILIFSFIIFIFLNKITKTDSWKIKNLNNLLYISLIFFILGSLPYLLVGLTPTFHDYASRHQILLKYSSVLLILYCYLKIKCSVKKNILIGFLVSISIFFTMSTQIQFLKSWLKQIAIEKYLSNNRSKLIGNYICVIDNAKQYNEYNTYFEPYLYSGILYKIYKNKSYLGVDIENRSFILNDPITKISYHIENLNKFSTFDSILIINLDKILLTKLNTIKFTFYFYFNKNKFNHLVDQILHFESYETKIVNQ